MQVAMMHVRVVRVLVHYHTMLVPMPVGFFAIPREVVSMLMMFVMPMRVAVR